MVELTIVKKKKRSDNIGYTMPIEEFIDMEMNDDESAYELKDIGEIKRLESKLEKLKRDHHKGIRFEFNQE